MKNNNKNKYIKILSLPLMFQILFGKDSFFKINIWNAAREILIFYFLNILFYFLIL